MKSSCLLLTLRTFSDNGGIQRSGRILAKSLQDIYQSEFKMYSLYDGDPDQRYIEPEYFTGFNGRKLSFVFRILNSTTKVLIVNHIHLIAFAILLKIFNVKLKIVLVAHGTEVWRAMPWWKRYFLRKHVNIWAVSDYTNKVLGDKHGLVKINTIHLCLDPFWQLPGDFKKPVYLLRRYNLPHDARIMFTLCRKNTHDREKGYERVICLIPGLKKEIPELHYFIAGRTNRSERIRLCKTIEALNLSNCVHLMEQIDEAELVDHYLLADLFIMPSTKEGFGMVFTEAAVSGCMVIAGDADGSREALIYGRLGITVDASDPRALHNSVKNSLANPLNGQRKFQQQSLALSEFNYEKYRTKIQQSLEQCES